MSEPLSRRRGPVSQRRVTEKNKDFDFADSLQEMALQIANLAQEPNIYGYEPHSKQQVFHESFDHLKLYVGGNRSGKSFSSVAETIYFLRGDSPHRELPFANQKVRGRIVAVDFDRGVDQILLPIFSRLLPPSMLINGSWEDSYQGGKHLLSLENGSTAEFMSYEQDTAKFAGTSRHFIYYDEEPPKHIFDECQARLVDTDGYSWIAMTPVEGATWLFDKVFDPMQTVPDRELLVRAKGIDIAPVYRSDSLNTLILEVGMNENPYLSPEAQERYLDTLDPDERKARSKGTFVTLGGKVFKNFNLDEHVTRDDTVPSNLQRLGWQIYSSVDHGWNSPTAWLWHAVSPDDEVITFGEHYYSEWTIEEHSAEVHRKEAEWGLNSEEILRTGDPAMHQHSGYTGTTGIMEYARHDIYIATESIPKDRGIGIGKMQTYFRNREQVDGVVRPSWRITEECENFIHELRRLRWKRRTSKKAQAETNPSEEVHQLHDHAFDSAKYFATFLLDLAPDARAVSKTTLVNTSNARYDLSLADRYAEKEAGDDIQWTVLESYSTSG